VPFLLEVFAFFVAFEAVLLRVFLAIVDPQCRTRLYLEHRRRMGHRARGVASALGHKRTSPTLFDHLVSAIKQLPRHDEA
jgi:hypothetical protein